MRLKVRGKRLRMLDKLRRMGERFSRLVLFNKDIKIELLPELLENLTSGVSSVMGWCVSSVMSWCVGG